MRIYKVVIQTEDPEYYIPMLFIMRRNYGRAGWRVKVIDMSANLEHQTVELIQQTQNPYDICKLWLDEFSDFSGAALHKFEEVKL